MPTTAERILAFFDNSDLPVLFAGAGVSARAGLPTWGGYLRQLAVAANDYDQFTKYQIDVAVDKGYLETAAAYYFLCKEMPDNIKWAELVKPLADDDHSGLHALAKLPFKSIATTNFDRALLNAHSATQGQAAKEVNIDDPTLAAATFDPEFYVARIHGRIEVPQSLRLTEDHLQRLSDNNAYVQFLTHIFTRRQVCFAGFSFRDPAITAALRAVRAAFEGRHSGNHIALIPTDAPGDFVGELERHSVARVTYDPANNHAALWAAIDEVEQTLSARTSARRGNPQRQPFAVAQKYLATSYARMRLGRQLAPLSRAVVEGLVSSIISRAPTGGVTEQEIVTEIRTELAIGEEPATNLVSQSLAALLRDGLCVPNGDDPPKFLPIGGGEGASFDRAIARLVKGADDRHSVREGQPVCEAGHVVLDSFFRAMVLRRGWDLGAAFAAKRMPEAFDVLALFREAARGSSLTEALVVSISRSIESLLRRPDDDEALLLAELGRAAFGLELVLEAPHDALFHQATLPERIYLDANVLMPALTKGHPHNPIFAETIRALQESASRAAINVSVCVYEGFLNEIVSHRRLATEQMEQSGGEGAMWAEREAQLRGTANVNVFIGAYLNEKRRDNTLEFTQFLEDVAPYHSEAELREFLKAREIRVLRENEVATRGMPEILHALEKFFAGKLADRKKNAIVIRHDAFQLAILNRDIFENRRSIFVSADQLLRVALDRANLGSLNNAMISHLGLTQLVELLIGKFAEPRGLASLLWMSSVSSETERIRTYLINIALAEHDAAMAMAMTDVVDALAEDFGFEIQRRGLSLETDRTENRAALNAALERVEKDFYAKMRAEVKRQGKGD